ncbi:MAG: hypothetical protein P8169_09895, partial [Chloroflexota bacterium]
RQAHILQRGQIEWQAERLSSSGSSELIMVCRACAAAERTQLRFGFTDRNRKDSTSATAASMLFSVVLKTKTLRTSGAL